MRTRPVRRHRILGSILLLASGWSGLRAQTVLPRGEEFQVNTTTTGSQYRPSIAGHADGSFVVVWSGPEILGQRFSADGTPQSVEFQINDATTDGVVRPTVEVTPDGGFVVAWTSLAPYPGADSIRARRFGANGIAAGTEFQVAVSTRSGVWGVSVNRPTVGVDASGGFVVAWGDSIFQCMGARCDPEPVGMARRFSLDDTPLGDAFAVTPDAYPKLAMSSAGDFIVVWSDYSGVQGQRFVADGTPDGSAFQISETGPDTIEPAVSIGAQGEFVVVWTRGSYGFYGPYSFYSVDVRGRRFAANASALGGEFVVAPSPPNYHSFPESPAIDHTGDGGFAVVWEYRGSDFDLYGVTFDDEGNRNPNFHVNSFTTANQLNADVVAHGLGDFTVVWQSTFSTGSDYDGFSIQARTFLAPSVFLDDFESGDLSRWNLSRP